MQATNDNILTPEQKLSKQISANDLDQENNITHVTPTPVAHEESKAEEFGGPKGPEPTRYGDWEQNGRVSDF